MLAHTFVAMLKRPFKHFLGALEGLMVGTKKSESKANQNMKGALKKVPAVHMGARLSLQ